MPMRKKAFVNIAGKGEDLMFYVTLDLLSTKCFQFGKDLNFVAW